MFKHETVLLHKTVDMLNVKPDGIYVDCTLGGGGHTSYLLNQLKKGHLYAFDQDITAIKHAGEKLAEKKHHVTFIKANFRQLKEELKKRGISEVDGILYDLGVSSPQLDVRTRGFSYHNDAPLDMRMDQSTPLTAREIVNEWDYKDLVNIFFRYGEEKFSKSIAREIERTRKIKAIETTEELVEVIKKAIPARARRTGGHPAKRTFQAIRIAVNDELKAIEESLFQALSLLKEGGRISVITFHSLEDRIAKQIFQKASKVKDLPPGLPIIPEEFKPKFELITKKPILPDKDELERNNRARSAKLRVIEKMEIGVEKCE